MFLVSPIQNPSSRGRNLFCWGYCIKAIIPTNAIIPSQIQQEVFKSFSLMCFLYTPEPEFIHLYPWKSFLVCRIVFSFLYYCLYCITDGTHCQQRKNPPVTGVLLIKLCVGCMGYRLTVGSAVCESIPILCFTSIFGVKWGPSGQRKYARGTIQTPLHLRS